MESRGKNESTPVLSYSYHRPSKNAIIQSIISKTLLKIFSKYRHLMSSHVSAKSPYGEQESRSFSQGNKKE